MPAWASGAWAPGAWAGTAWAQSGVTVPDVVGETQESGTAILEGAGFVALVQTTHSSTVPAGQIVSQSPSAGAEVPAGATITIIVSLGDAPVVGEQPSGGYGYLNDYQAWKQRREARRRAQEALREKAQDIADDVTRELAERLQAAEAEAQTKAEHARLREIARRFEAEAADFGERVQAATTRAIARGTFSAMEALARELSRLAEEELFLMQASLMILRDEGYEIA